MRSQLTAWRMVQNDFPLDLVPQSATSRICLGEAEVRRFIKVKFTYDAGYGKPDAHESRMNIS